MIRATHQRIALIHNQQPKVAVVNLPDNSPGMVKIRPVNGRSHNTHDKIIKFQIRMIEIIIQRQIIIIE